MKNVLFLLLFTGIFMTTACSTTGTNEASDQDATTETEATSAATEEAAKSTSTETPAEETSVAKAPATTESSSDGSSMVWVCTKNDRTRTIRIVYPSEGPVCEVTYEKSSGTQTLWSANNDKSDCEDKAIEFVTRQEGWDWSCNKQ